MKYPKRSQYKHAKQKKYHVRNWAESRGEGRERYFGCNLMQRKVLASSHQHLMAEAPDEAVIL